MNIPSFPLLTSPVLISLFGLLIFEACEKEKSTPATSVILTEGNIDSLLYAQSNKTEDFGFFLNKDTVRRSTSASAHSPYFRIRFNKTAQSVLGPDGRLPEGKKFPEGSIIVKDLFNSPDGERVLVAIMKKESQNPYSAGGWLWNELLSDGGPYVAAKDKGTLCVSCHSVSKHDLVRSFELF